MPIEKKTKLKNLIIAFVSAVVLSGAQFWVAVNFSQKILWQSNIMLLLVGPGPIIGYNANGRPMYEGTPVHIVAAYFGLIFGVFVYTVIFNLLISRWHKRKTSS